MSVKLLYNNILETAGTITVSPGADTSYPAYRLYDRHNGRLFKFSGLTAPSVVVSGGGAIDTLVIPAPHNLNGLRCILRHADDNTYSELSDWLEDISGSNGTGTTALTAFNTHSSAHALNMAITGNTAGVKYAGRYSEHIPVSTAKAYTVSMWCILVSGTAKSSFYAYFYDANKSPVGSAKIFHTAYTVPGTYTQKSYTINPADFPAGAAYIRLRTTAYSNSGSGNGSHNVDDMVFAGPDGINLLHNPGFEGGVILDWTQANTANIYKTFTSNAAYRRLEVVSVAGGNPDVIPQFTELFLGQSVTLLRQPLKGSSFGPEYNNSTELSEYKYPYITNHGPNVQGRAWKFSAVTAAARDQLETYLALGGFKFFWVQDERGNWSWNYEASHSRFTEDGKDTSRNPLYSFDMALMEIPS